MSAIQVEFRCNLKGLTLQTRLLVKKAKSELCLYKIWSGTKMRRDRDQLEADHRPRAMSRSVVHVSSPSQGIS